jgi:hypothetical protein
MINPTPPNLQTLLLVKKFACLAAISSIISFSLPAQAQWATHENCADLEASYYQNGYCVGYDAPVASTYTYEGYFVAAGRIDVGYQVGILDERSGEMILEMVLNQDRTVIRLTHGNEAIAEDHRAAILGVLDFAEYWESL